MSESLDSKKVFLITGTSRGLGRYLAEYYVKLGHRVVGCSRGVSAFSNELYTHLNADVADEKDILNIFKFIRSEIKKLDVLINNAAIMPPMVSAVFLPYETIEKTFKTNVFAPMTFCREAVKVMSKNKFGRIVNIGSIATKHEVSGSLLYTSSKVAMISYTSILAKEIYKLGITANVVSPSLMKTDILENANEEKIKAILSRCAISDYGEMEDTSNVIDLLIKKESSALTGQVFYLGGA